MSIGFRTHLASHIVYIYYWHHIHTNHHVVKPLNVFTPPTPWFDSNNFAQCSDYCVPVNPDQCSLFEFSTVLNPDVSPFLGKGRTADSLAGEGEIT